MKIYGQPIIADGIDVLLLSIAAAGLAMLAAAVILTSIYA